EGLDGRPIYPAGQGLTAHWRLLSSYADRVPVGFQAKPPRSMYGRLGTGGTALLRKRAIFSRMLANARELGASFLEIYESQMNDPDLADLLREAKGWLGRPHVK